MPVAVSYPGVYLEEIPSGVRTITGVSTSVTAFVGHAPKGPLDKAVRLFDYGSYEREFGGLHRDSELGYAVQQFFLNGGGECWIVRVAQGALKAKADLANEAGGTVLNVSARTAGAWGNLVRLEVSYAGANPDSSFNLTVTEYVQQGAALVPGRSETFLNLTMNPASPDYAVATIKASSQLIDADKAPGAPGAAAGKALSGDLTGTSLADPTRKLQIIVDGDGPHEIELFASGGNLANLDAIRGALESKIKAINPALPRFNNFKVERATAAGTVDAAGTHFLLTSGAALADHDKSYVRVLPAASNDAAAKLKLGLAAGGREIDGAAAMRPAPSGTISKDLSATDLTALNPAHQVKADAAETADPNPATGTFTLGAAPTNLANLATILQARLRASNPARKEIADASVTIQGQRLVIRSGDPSRPKVKVTFSDQGGGTVAGTLGLAAGSAAQLTSYSLAGGVDGNAPTGIELTGSRAAKTGLFALEEVDILNLLSIPRTGDLAENEGKAVIDAAIAYCQERRAFLLVDPPKTRKTVPQAEDYVNNVLTKSNYAAVFFPWVQIPDPLDKFRLRDVAPSGTIAGVIARTDTARGVWKAPAGTEATLVNVPAVSLPMTDLENGVLNKIGCNCIRQFPVYGRINWGARTLRGADVLADDYKYIPVRRLALYIEESLFRGSKWIVFEPNDEPLWSQIRLNFGAFMHDLFSKGAFQGTTPREAYFVKCDRETTTQNDIDKGIVNIVVGFAPLKPAEFVIIQIQQITNQQAN